MSIRNVSLVLSLMFSLLLSLAATAQDTGLSGASAASLNTSLSKWGFSYFSFSTAGQKDVQAGKPSVFMYNYLGANYKLNSDERINFRPVFLVNTAGADASGKEIQAQTKLGDAYINYANYKLGILPGNWELSGQFRIYLPTSEATQAKKTIAYLHSWMKSTKFLGDGWALDYNFKPTYRIQSRPSVVTETLAVNRRGESYMKREDRVNQIGELEHYLSIGKYVNKIFVPKLDLGFTHEWNYTSTENKFGNASRNQLQIAPNTEIHVTRSLWFILGIENAIDLNDTRIADGKWKAPNGQSIKLFQPEDTQYYLLTFLTL